MQSRFFVFVFASVIALQMSPSLVADGLGEGNQMSPGLVAGRSGAGNKESKTLTVTKECGTAPLAPGELGYCTVIASNFRPLRGAKIRYFGPGFFTPAHPFLDSRVVIESDQEGAAPPLAIAWSEGSRRCWEPASSPGGAARSRASKPT